MTKALVVLSGGQDSVTCLGWALDRFDEVYALTFDYGQRHARELEAAAAVVHHFATRTGRHVSHEVLHLPAGVLAGSSPLTDHSVDLERYANFDAMNDIIGDRVELTFVPMRNALFLTVAANRAAVYGCDKLVTGVCQGDNQNYPDCREAFVKSQQHTINLALGRGRNVLRILTPLMDLSKAQTVELATKLPHTYAALALSHTAYDGSYPPRGDDHASVLRAHGFEQADIPDPLILRAKDEGAITELPTTRNYRPSALHHARKLLAAA